MFTFQENKKSSQSGLGLTKVKGKGIALTLPLSSGYLDQHSIPRMDFCRFSQFLLQADGFHNPPILIENIAHDLFGLPKNFGTA